MQPPKMTATHSFIQHLTQSFCTSLLNSKSREGFIKRFPVVGSTGLCLSPWVGSGCEPCSPQTPGQGPRRNVAAQKRHPTQSWSLLAYTSALSRDGPRFTDVYEGSEVPRDLGTASCVIWESWLVAPSASPLSLTEEMNRAGVRGAELTAPLSWAGTFLLRHGFHRGHLRPSFQSPVFLDCFLCARPCIKESVTLLELGGQFTSLTELDKCPQRAKILRETGHSTQ